MANSSNSGTRLNSEMQKFAFVPELKNYFLGFGFGLAVFFFFAAGFFATFFFGAGFVLSFGFVVVVLLGLGLSLGAAGRVGFSAAGSGPVSAGGSIIGSEVSSCPAPALSGDSS